MRCFITLVLFMCANWRLTEGTAYASELKTETKMFGPRGKARVIDMPYCEWEGIKMMIGSGWRTVGCEECSCSDEGLFCAGPGLYTIPDHCLMLVNENCETEMVDANDPLSPCIFPGPDDKQ
ncbi:PREDICTED: uncharacterized protein LOC109486969 [Branchiostoma belcheri]|uniref:Uncharacterized protein LOC109486969 n=1 Tax=Branchiostoma belcheri TaxID=7741 RepID=A0A6P4ZZA9_BRABE|nr:PREDICTED: uncharacterized protein LOC109486969 [Branchiostoma belcheri]